MKKYKYFLLLVLCSIFAGCGDVLDKTPLSSPSSATFLSDKSQIEMAIVGAHSPLMLQFDQIPFNIYFDNGSDIAAERDVKPQDLYFDTSSGQVKSIWTYMYQGISRCNYILDNINRSNGKITEDEMNGYIAKTKVLRAYYYHVLVSLFGDVPLIDHTQSLNEAYVSRTEKSKVVDFIISTCEEAIPYLAEDNKPNTMAISKGLAYAIIARTALYNERWDKAIEACKKIMDMQGKQYQLDPSYSNLTMIAGKTSKEIIWAIQYNQDDLSQYCPKKFASRLGGGYSNKMPVQALVDSYECTDGLTIDKSPLYDPQHPWNNRDPRLGYTVALPGTVYLGYEFNTNKDSLMCWNYNVTPAVRINNLDATHTYASFSGYCWRKYVDKSELRTDGASSINAIVFRYAEILLTYAEAKIEKNDIDQTVYDAINDVRKRVGMPNIPNGETQQELRCSVRKERKYEFAGEGLRMFDILRWKLAEKLMNGLCYGRVPRGYPTTAPTIDEYGNPDYTNFSEKDKFGTKLGMRIFDAAKNYLCPIPISEIEVNSNLVQNPNY